MVERGSDKHGPNLDEALKHEVEGTVRARRSTHAEEWKDPEPSGEDQPEVDQVPEGTLTGGTPPGMTAADVTRRAELAGYLGKSVYPAVRDELLVVLSERGAPEELIQLVATLPADERYQNVNEVAEELGLGVERGRF